MKAAAEKIVRPAKSVDSAALSLDDDVYAKVKAMILSNRLRAGQKLAHQHIADQLQVSRTPVRQALERLFQEGYVVRLPARGYYVAEINSREARDLYQMRMALEPYALRTAMMKGISAEELEELARLLKVYAAHVSENTIYERVLSDQAFHLYLASLAGNQFLLDTLRRVFERLLLKRRTDGFWPGTGKRGREGVAEHEALMVEIRNGRVSAAERVMRKHLTEALAHFEAHLLQLSLP